MQKTSDPRNHKKQHETLLVEIRVISWIVFLVFVLLLVGACSFDPFAKSFSGPDNIRLTAADSPLPENAFNAVVELAYQNPSTMKPGERAGVHFVITNSSNSRWPSGGPRDRKYRISVGNHWLDRQGRTVIQDDARSVLPYDLEPGQKAEVLLNVIAPTEPGTYILEVDLVQEQVAWFSEKGSRTIRFNVVVEGNS